MVEAKTMDTTASVYFGRIEVRDRNFPRREVKAVKLQKLLLKLRQTAVQDHPIIDVIEGSTDQDPILIGCFGHDARCDDGCRKPVHGGVWRFFGFRLVIEGEPDNRLFGVYQIEPGSQLVISGVTIPHDRDRTPLKRLHGIR